METDLPRGLSQRLCPTHVLRIAQAAAGTPPEAAAGTQAPAAGSREEAAGTPAAAEHIAPEKRRHSAHLQKWNAHNELVSSQLLRCLFI